MFIVQIMYRLCQVCAVNVNNETNFIVVNNAISTDSTQRQWVNLGNLSIACLTVPDTCGSAGGALSAWIKIGDTDFPTGGIISLFAYSEGFQVFVYLNELR